MVICKWSFLFPCHHLFAFWNTPSIFLGSCADCWGIRASSQLQWDPTALGSQEEEPGPQRAGQMGKGQGPRWFPSRPPGVRGRQGSPWSSFWGGVRALGHSVSLLEGQGWWLFSKWSSSRSGGGGRVEKTIQERSVWKLTHDCAAATWTLVSVYLASDTGQQRTLATTYIVCETSFTHTKGARFSPPETLRVCVAVKLLFIMRWVCVHRDVCIHTSVSTDHVCLSVT